MKTKVIRGRTSSLTPAKIQTALLLRDKGFSILEIAKALGVDESTLYRKGSEWEALRNELNARKAAQDAERVEEIEKSLYKRAKGYKTKEKREQYDPQGNLEGYTITTKEIPADVKAQTLFLTNRAPDRWQAIPDGSNEAGSGNGSIKIEIVEGEK